MQDDSDPYLINEREVKVLQKQSSIKEIRNPSSESNHKLPTLHHNLSHQDIYT